MDTQTEKMAREAIEEARMVLPGIQALFGFQLIAVFSERFNELASGEQVAHLVAVLMVVLSIALIMTPAAYHRQVEPRTVSGFFLRLTSTLVALAMLPLAVAMCIEVYLVGHIVLGNPTSSFAMASCSLAAFAALWYVFPWRMSRRQGSANR